MSFKDNLVKVYNDRKFYVQKNSPDILVGVGLACLVGALVYTVKGTLNTANTMYDAYSELEDVDEEDSSSKKKIYISASIDIARNYSPAAILATGSAACLIGSNAIMRKRAIGMAAAYSMLESSFSEYRDRVVEKYGKDADQELKHGFNIKSVDSEHVDEETGEIVKATHSVADSNGSVTNIWYKRQYELDDGTISVNPNWQPNADLNITWIKAQCNWFNGCLSRGEHIWLDDVFHELGIPCDNYRGEAHLIGWTPSKDGTKKLISFNAYGDETDNEFITNEDGDVLLEFNPDGMLYYK